MSGRSLEPKMCVADCLTMKNHLKLSRNSGEIGEFLLGFGFNSILVDLSSSRLFRGGREAGSSGCASTAGKPGSMLHDEVQ